jgi:hypothetical protein
MSATQSEGRVEFVCPSARCEVGSQLLGIVGPDGVVGFISPPIPLDAEFVERAHEGRTPEGRFRFANRCVEEHCGFWTGHRCGVIDAAVDALSVAERAPLRPCMIRAQCRWFHQHGRGACDVCPLIVTEVTGDR